ncbi:MAG: transposase, partial [Victivallales bacterium]|nr:transposase [Victivallales bacterium]
MLANELRPGNQHSAKGAVEFVSRCIRNARKVGVPAEKLLLRMDSGHDDRNLLETLCKSGVNFLIKRNLRSESREQYLAIARRCGEKISSRDGKNVYRCTLSHRKPSGLKDMPLFMIVEVTERLTWADGQELLIPEVEVSAWWTNLPESETVCIELYRAHA